MDIRVFLWYNHSNHKEISKFARSSLCICFTWALHSVSRLNKDWNI